MADNPNWRGRGSSDGGGDPRKPKPFGKRPNQGSSRQGPPGEGRPPRERSEGNREFRPPRDRNERYGEGRPPRERSEGNREFRPPRDRNERYGEGRPPRERSEGNREFRPPRDRNERYGEGRPPRERSEGNREFRPPRDRNERYGEGRPPRERSEGNREFRPPRDRNERYGEGRPPRERSEGNREFRPPRDRNERYGEGRPPRERSEGNREFRPPRDRNERYGEGRPPRERSEGNREFRPPRDRNERYGEGRPPRERSEGNREFRPPRDRNERYGEGRPPRERSEGNREFRPPRDRNERYGEGRPPRERSEGNREFRPPRDRNERYGEGRPPRERSEGNREFRPPRSPSAGSEKGRVIRAQKNWGSISRKGAVKAVDFKEDRNREESRTRLVSPPEPFVPDGFVQVDDDVPIVKSPGVRSRRTQVRSQVIEELLEKEVTFPLTPAKRNKVQRLLASAIDTYEREKYGEAKRILEEVLIIAPDSLSAQELYGLSLYRVGQWAPAIKVLESFSEKSGSYDQYPVLADCYRAQKRYQDVDRIWTDLAAASPSRELVGEGRIVVAGSAADQGQLSKAIALLERSLMVKRKPAFIDLRQWYVLADFYERAGELGHAKSLFSRIIKHDANFVDVAERLSDLG